MRLIDLTGTIVGRLTVVRRLESRQGPTRKRVYWLCRCSCGKTVEVVSDSLRGEHTQSCGCLMLDTNRTTEPRAPEFCPDGSVKIDLGNGMHAIVDADDQDLAAAFTWNATKGKTGGYYASRHTPRPEKKTIKLHHEVARRMGIDTKPEVDHRDGDGLNCRRNNLRTARKDQNAQNAKIRADNKTGHKGVVWNADRECWQAYITIKKKRTYLGAFDDPAVGGAAYWTAAQKHFGEFARLR